MKLRNVIAVLIAATAAALAGSAISVSAAEPISGDYLDTLIESGNADLIIDVNAYRAAYSDLDAAFGDNTNAYIEHYLTLGIYEGRTKGVLFNPLAYAEAYDDIEEAFGDNLTAIVDHYITFGITENRTEGTACGYADIAEAETAMAARATGNSSYSSPTIGSRPNNYVSNSGSSSYSANTSGGSSSSSAGGNSSYSANTSSSNSSSNTGSTGGNSNASTDSNRNYHHTTSIYDDDDVTLLRVEYYDEKGNLSEFSQVTNYDNNTNSYTENIYHYDESSDTVVLDRTDTYVNGVLSSSE